MEAAIKRQLHTKSYIDEFWENLLKVRKDKLTLQYIKARLELFETYWKKFLDTHDVLAGLEGIDETDYVKLNLFSSTEENYLVIKSRLSAKLVKGDTPALHGEPSNSNSIIKQIQLPRINLPTFSGDQLSWEGFRNLFKSLVHEVEGLAPVQKLQYLRASLSGEAAAAIAYIEMSSAGYTLAWEELVTRCDNKRILLASHMRAVLSSPPVFKASASEIKRLITMINQASRSFQLLGRPVEHWDDWFVHLLVEKLDSALNLLWESLLSTSQEFPRIKDLMDFLQVRVHALEAAGPRPNQLVSPSAHKPKKNRKDEVATHATSAHSDSTDSRKTCPLCREQHPFRICAKFKAFTLDQRRECVRKKRACYNCLGQDHPVANCPSSNRCRLCQEKHHTMLHGSSSETTTAGTPKDPTPINSTSMTAPDSATAPAADSKVVAFTSATNHPVLLATARVVLIGDSGLSVTVRAFLDSGSEASFVTERVAQLLKLPRRRVNVAITGLQGTATGTVTHAVSFMVGTDKSPSVWIAIPRALVLPRLSSLIPGRQIPRAEWSYLDGLSLADPNFAKPAAVDAILGADVFGLLLDNGVRRGPPGAPTAHQTIFGWVLMGTLSTQQETETHTTMHHTVIQTDLQDDLRRFWELENVPTERILTPEETSCEEYFTNTYFRDAQSCYVVRLPRKEDASIVLGNSRLGALRMLQSTERRLSRDTILREKYHDFMTAYMMLGHMERVPRGKVPISEGFYLPHHAVVKAMDLDCKIRAVFNASFRTPTGFSLNDLLLSGPKLQSELWLVLTRWRLFQFAPT